MKRALLVGFLVMPAAVSLSTAQVLADTYTRIDVSDTAIGFSNSLYGPWISQDARLVFVNPGQGAINFEVAHQEDGDVMFPTRGNYFAAGITRDLTSRLYGWVNFGYGTTYPFPKTDLHLELNYKTTPDLKLIMGASEDLISYYGGQTLKEFSAGPTYYYPSGVVQLRYTLSANSGAATKSGFLAAWDITPTFRSKYTLTGLFGPQQYLVSIPGLPVAQTNISNGQTYSASTEQQVGRTNENGMRWGLRIAGLLSHLTNADTGGALYSSRGFSFGLWSIF